MANEESQTQHRLAPASHGERETCLEETAHQRSVWFFGENELEPGSEQMVAQCWWTVQCARVWINYILLVRVDRACEDMVESWSSTGTIFLWADFKGFYSSSPTPPSPPPQFFYASWEAKQKCWDSKPLWEVQIYVVIWFSPRRDERLSSPNTCRTDIW